MLDKARSRPDLLLLLSLVLVIVMYPTLDHGDFRKLTLGTLVFVPLILAAVRLAHRKGWVWPTVLLMAVTLLSGVGSTIYPIPILVGTKWGLLSLCLQLAWLCALRRRLRCDLVQFCEGDKRRDYRE